jgi:hypothetical protein
MAMQHVFLARAHTGTQPRQPLRLQGHHLRPQAAVRYILPVATSTPSARKNIRPSSYRRQPTTSSSVWSIRDGQQAQLHHTIAVAASSRVPTHLKQRAQAARQTDGLDRQEHAPRWSSLNTYRHDRQSDPAFVAYRFSTRQRWCRGSGYKKCPRIHCFPSRRRG